MLIKSVKHDLLATYRDFTGIYTALLLLAVIAPFILNSRIDWLIAVFVAGFFGVSIATIVITFMTIIRLYTRRLFSNEGYLTLTLPVKTSDTIIAKVITGLIWSALTAVVFALAMLLFTLVYYLFLSMSGSKDILGLFTILKLITNSGALWIVIQTFLIGLPLTLVQFVDSLILLIFVITLVNTSLIRKYKVPLGIALYMIINMLVNAAQSALTADPVVVNGNALTLNPSGPISFSFMNSLSYSVNGLNYALLMIGSLLLIAALGYGTWWLLEHKLEVE